MISVSAGSRSPMFPYEPPLLSNRLSPAITGTPRHESGRSRATRTDRQAAPSFRFVLSARHSHGTDSDEGPGLSLIRILTETQKHPSWFRARPIASLACRRLPKPQPLIKTNRGILDSAAQAYCGVAVLAAPQQNLQGLRAHYLPAGWGDLPNRQPRHVLAHIVRSCLLAGEGSHPGTAQRVPYAVGLRHDAEIASATPVLPVSGQLSAAWGLLDWLSRFLHARGQVQKAEDQGRFARQRGPKLHGHCLRGVYHGEGERPSARQARPTALTSWGCNSSGRGSASAGSALFPPTDEPQPALRATLRLGRAGDRPKAQRPQRLASLACAGVCSLAAT